MIDLDESYFIVSSIFKRLVAIDKASLKEKSVDFAWLQPPKKGSLNMIT